MMDFSGGSVRTFKEGQIVTGWDKEERNYNTIKHQIDFYLILETCEDSFTESANNSEIAVI